MSSRVLALRVLYVDDDEIMREVWPLHLGRLGFDVVVAEGATRALDLARFRMPDVIVTDMMMPGMTGIDLFHALRSDSTLSAVPVIFMTSGTFPPDRPAKDCWLGKDISPEELAEKILGLLA